MANHHRTITNWRWWVCLPLLLVLLPVAILVGLMRAAGEWADIVQDYLRPLTQQMLRWATTHPTQEADK